MKRTIRKQRKDGIVQRYHVGRKKKGSRYTNDKGTFKRMTDPSKKSKKKSKFYGCQRKMISKGYDLDASAKICGKIAARKNFGFSGFPDMSEREQVMAVKAGKKPIAQVIEPSAKEIGKVRGLKRMEVLLGDKAQPVIDTIYFRKETEPAAKELAQLLKSKNKDKDFHEKTGTLLGFDKDDISLFNVSDDKGLEIITKNPRKPSSTSKYKKTQRERFFGIDWV